MVICSRINKDKEKHDRRKKQADIFLFSLLSKQTDSGNSDPLLNQKNVSINIDSPFYFSSTVKMIFTTHVVFIGKHGKFTVADKILSFERENTESFSVSILILLHLDSLYTNVVIVYLCALYTSWLFDRLSPIPLKISSEMTVYIVPQTKIKDFSRR